jgi:superfamily II DNA or RNA helicase
MTAAFDLLGGAERRKTRVRGFAPWNPQPTALALLALVRAVLTEYAEHLPLTIRQVFYRLVGAHGFDKTERAYERLCETMNRARRARLIPMDAIRDDGGQTVTPSAWEGAEDFLSAVRAQAERLVLDRSAGQPTRIIVMCTAGMVPQLARVAEPYGVPVISSGGFESVTDKHRLAVDLADDGRPTEVLHIGDHDPSGAHLFLALAEDVQAFADELGGVMLREAVGRGERRIIMQGPTGMGKTVITADMAERARAKKKRVLITVPALSLVDQTVEMLGAQGVTDIGVIQAQHQMTDPSRSVQVASIQTLMRRTAVPQADVVLVDECHKWFKFYEQWFQDPAWANVPFIGMSATPWTRGLGSYYRRLVIANTIKDMIEQGTLSRFRVFAPDHPDLNGVRTVAGDYHEGDLYEKMGKAKLVADIVANWKSFGEGRPTICFAVNRAHADQIAKEFEAAGVPSGYMDCETPLLERAAVRTRLLTGRINVVCNVDVIGLGVDWPEISCIIMARPTKSEMRYCLDAETEVLTSHGWRGMGQIKEGDCVATLADINGVAGKWSRVLGVVDRDMAPDESWVEYDAPRANFRITDQHRMIFAERETFRRKGHVEAAYKIGTANEMLKPNASWRMPTAVEMSQPGVPLTDAELYFIGMMMTDGTWRERSGGISQSERHPEVIERIERCLKECGIAYSKRRMPSPSTLHAAAIIERHPRWQYSLSFGKPVEGLAKPRRGRHLNAIKHQYERVSGITGFGHLMPFLDKDFAPALMALSKRQFFTLLQGIHDGDGFKMKSPSVDWTPRSWTLCSSRKVFVDRLQALATINGCTGHLHPEPQGRKNPLYVLTISPKNWRSVGGYNSKGRGLRPQINRAPATAERVWCIETETGTIVTRRRGKVTVMGNCQNIGRGLRVHPGKKDLIVIDHSDTTLRLGFVSDIHHDELDDGKPTLTAKPVIALPKECPKCHYLKPPRTAVCPACGFVAEHHAKPIATAPGQLLELNGDAFKVAPVARLLQGKAETYGQLMWYAESKGYNRGWAANKYRTIYGVWPRGHDWMQHLHAPEMALASWIKSQNIRWAKSKRRRFDSDVVNGTNHANGHANGNGNGHTAASPEESGKNHRAMVPGTLCTTDDLKDFT